MAVCCILYPCECFLLKGAKAKSGKFRSEIDHYSSGVFPLRRSPSWNADVACFFSIYFKPEIYLNNSLWIWFCETKGRVRANMFFRTATLICAWERYNAYVVPGYHNSSDGKFQICKELTYGHCWIIRWTMHRKIPQLVWIKYMANIKWKRTMKYVYVIAFKIIFGLNFNQRRFSLDTHTRSPGCIYRARNRYFIIQIHF